VTFCWGPAEHREQSFADTRVDAKDGGLRASVDVIGWHESCIVIGATKALIFPGAGDRPSTVVLNRSEEADPGFFMTEVVTVSEVLLIIYEGGVIAVDALGTLRWHAAKHWDDIYVGVTGSSLRFENEAGSWRLEAETGEGAPRPMTE